MQTHIFDSHDLYSNEIKQPVSCTVFQNFYIMKVLLTIVYIIILCICNNMS